VKGPTIPSREHSSSSRGSRARVSRGVGNSSFINDNPVEAVFVVPENNTKSSSFAKKDQGSNTNNSFSYKLAKWTKKVSGFSCGATLTSSASVEESGDSIMASCTHRHAVSDHKPPRTNTSNMSSNQATGFKTHQIPIYNAPHIIQKAVEDFDHDHHTLGTAATASATISYSTDQGDDASEMGMEVIMSNSVDIMGGSSATSSSAIGAPEEPYASHTFPAGKHSFTVDSRYSMIRTIGSGAYGVVISALDAKSNTNVAIKMVPKAFSDEIDAKRILREIKLLKHFRHENIVSIVDMMPPNVNYIEDFIDVYIVTDLMETDLHRIIYSKQKLSIDHAQYFIYQVLRGLKYIHSCRVLHRDLKPSNLLVNSNCDLKICDFGLARGIDDQRSNADGRSGTMLLTEYVVTRWYRAPEIMLACHEYSYAIDVWSVGCIFAELILRKPYFPGDDYIDQVCLARAIVIPGKRCN
jgi:tRNA A-37 threonylcarbamoyl transferase component Bud32